MTDTPKARVGGGQPAKMAATDVTPEMVQEWFTDALRGSVGRGKPFSREEVSEGAHINPNTLGSWLSERNLPLLWQFVRLSALLGPDLVNQLLRPIGMGGCDWLVPDETGLFQVHALVADFQCGIAQALADDGRIDAREQAEIDRQLERVVTAAQRYQAGRRARINTSNLRLVARVVGS